MMVMVTWMKEEKSNPFVKRPTKIIIRNNNNTMIQRQL